MQSYNQGGHAQNDAKKNGQQEYKGLKESNQSPSREEDRDDPSAKEPVAENSASPQNQNGKQEYKKL